MPAWRWRQALLPVKACLKRLPSADEGAVLHEQVGDVCMAVAHCLVQRIHAVAVAHVKAGLTLLQQHPHLCSAGGGPSATNTTQPLARYSDQLPVRS